MVDSILLSALRQTPLSSTIATQDWALSTFTEISVTNQLSNEIVDGLSNTVIPKLDVITGLVSAEVDKLDEISSKLSTFALTGHTHVSSDITDLPPIPTVNDGILTIQKNGDTITSFTANQSDSVTANIEVPSVTLNGNSLTVDNNSVTIPTIELNGNTITVNDSSVSVPNVILNGSSLTVDSNSVTIPYVSINGNSLTVDSNNVTIPNVSVNGNSLTVDGNTFFIPSIQASNNSLTVDGYYYSIPNVSLMGNTLTVDSNIVTIPYVSINGNSLTVDSNNVTIPNVSLNGNSLTVDTNTVTIPTYTSQLTNDSDFLTSSDVDLSIYAEKSDLSNYLPLSGGTLTGGLTAEAGITFSDNSVLSSTNEIEVAKESGQVLAVSAISNNDTTTINLTKKKYVYRFTDDLSSGAFPTLVAPSDVLTPSPYYFTFEIEWTTNTSIASYSQSFDWINYPEIVLDGASHTYYIAGRWDSSGSGASAFMMNCWRIK